MTVSFLKQSDKPSAQIYVQVSIRRGKVLKRRTGYVGDLKKQALRLKELAVKIERAYNDAVERGIDPDGTWLENVIAGGHTKQTVQGHIELILSEAHKRPNAKGGTGLSEGRIKVYRTFSGVLNRFQKDVPLGVVNAAFAEKFKDWLFKKEYAVNTVGKYLELLKTVCRDAELKGAKIPRDLYQTKTLREKTKITILSPSEQRKIKECVLPYPYLRNARKWLLLGCQIGQRGSDLLSLTESDLLTIQGHEVFKVKQFKTGKVVYVPLTPEAKDILKDGFPHEISLQKFNKYVKEIADAAGVKKKLSSHICRRSFASNNYGKIPTPVLMGITGHSSEEMFRKYIGTTSLDNAMEFIKYF